MLPKLYSLTLYLIVVNSFVNSLNYVSVYSMKLFTAVQLKYQGARYAHKDNSHQSMPLNDNEYC